MKPCKPEALLKLADDAAREAYCPYSKYRVGAALLAADGRTFCGCNVENASYGLTLCAERAAFAAAVAAGRRRFLAVAVVAAGPAMPYPCGACRQVMAEFCGPDFAVHIARRAQLRAFETHRLADLLPKSFRFSS